jgi:hypothetical protein
MLASSGMQHRTKITLCLAWQMQDFGASVKYRSSVQPDVAVHMGHLRILTKAEAAGVHMAQHLRKFHSCASATAALLLPTFPTFRNLQQTTMMSLSSWLRTWASLVATLAHA